MFFTSTHCILENPIFKIPTGHRAAICITQFNDEYNTGHYFYWLKHDCMQISSAARMS